MLSPHRNVTFAVNYEVSHLWQSPSQAKANQTLPVESVPESTGNINPIPGNNNSKPYATPPDPGKKLASISENKPSTVTNMDTAPPLPFPEAETNNASLPDKKTSTAKASSAGTESTADKSCTATAGAAITTGRDSNAGDAASAAPPAASLDKPKSVDFKMPVTDDSNTSVKRRSSRELKKRQVPVERTRVRYDMELVPAVKRNRAFLDKFPLWMVPTPNREDKILALQMHQQAIIKQHQQKLQLLQKQHQSLVNQQPTKQQPLVEQKQTGKPPKVPQSPLLPTEQHQVAALLDPGSNSDVENAPCQHRAGNDIVNAEGSFPYANENTSPELVDDQDAVSPFAEDTSVIWVPKKRQDWEDSVFEMTAVCTSAAMRRYSATGRKTASSKPFQPPLSREYIKDRVDIDDPLNGYQIRHRSGGWLQGFILWTNFTTWTHYFRWDSSHAMSGIPTMNNKQPALVDMDGSVAANLEMQPRSGNPLEGGVVFEAVAEISLVGGIGCGEYLLRMALDSIRATRKYKFVVLQATDSSKTFYERFGFVRVGAICRYERRDKGAGLKPGGTGPVTPIMGYRHWTHPNESDSSLQMHGGPSYMMCLTLPEDDPDDPIETPFLDEMMKLEVLEKPSIDQLGGSSTPYPKGRRGSVDSTSSNSSNDAQLARSGLKKKGSKSRRGSSGSPRTVTATSLRQTFDAKIPPALPALGGTKDTPVRNAAAAAKSMVNSSGVKRGATIATGNQTTKKRRLSAPAGATAPGDKSRTRARQHGTPLKNGAGAKGLPLGAQAKQIYQTGSSKKASSKRATPRRNSDQIFATGKRGAASPAPATSTKPSGSERSPDPSRSGLTKQKVKSYPRDRVHFYNKVVRPKKGKSSENYFVLNYDEDKNTIRIIPMEARGLLSGKRAGRPRFQVVMSSYPRNAKTVSCDSYDIVKAFMVMKTPVVASEAWDVLDA